MYERTKKIKKNSLMFFSYTHKFVCMHECSRVDAVVAVAIAVMLLLLLLLYLNVSYVHRMMLSILLLYVHIV